MDSNSQGRVSGLGISSISVSASGSIDLKGSACYDEGTATNSIATDKVARSAALEILLGQALSVQHSLPYLLENVCDRITTLIRT